MAPRPGDLTRNPRRPLPPPVPIFVMEPDPPNMDLVTPEPEVTFVVNSDEEEVSTDPTAILSVSGEVDVHQPGYEVDFIGMSALSPILSPIPGAVGGADPYMSTVAEEDCLPFMSDCRENNTDCEWANPGTSSPNPHSRRRLFQNTTGSSSHNDQEFLFSPGPYDNTGERRFTQLGELFEQLDDFFPGDAPAVTVESNASRVEGNTLQSTNPVEIPSSQSGGEYSLPCECFVYQSTGECSCLPKVYSV